MAAFVLDASVALSWCFPGPTEDTAYSRRILRELATYDAIVPDVWAFDVANGIFVSYSKRKRISDRQIADYLELLKALPIRVEPQGLWANVNLESLARSQNLAAYDAAYLDLALRTGLPISCCRLLVRSSFRLSNFGKCRCLLVVGLHSGRRCGSRLLQLGFFRGLPLIATPGAHPISVPMRLLNGSLSLGEYDRRQGQDADYANHYGLKSINVPGT